MPAWIVGWMIGKINPDMKPRYAQTLIRRAFKDILFISGVKVTVKGQENILQGESAMYAFNHRHQFFFWLLTVQKNIYTRMHRREPSVK